MRGTETKQATMLSLLSPEQRVPKDHPLRRVKQLADQALRELSPVTRCTRPGAAPPCRPNGC